MPNSKLFIHIFSLLAIIVTSNIYGSTLLFTDKIDPELRKKIEKLSNENPSNIQDIIINAGYLDVSVLENNDTLFIYPSVKYLIGDLYIDNLRINGISDDLPFTEINFDNLIDHQLDNKKDNGYHFAKFSIDKILKNNSEVDVYLLSDLGPQLRINKIKYDGLSRTNSKIMDVYVKQLNDSILSRTNLDKLTAQVKSIDFLRYNPPPKIYPNEGYNKADIVFDMSEKKQVLFEGGFGFLPESSIFIWNLNLNFQNVFGAGRKFGLKNDRRNKNRHLFEVSYSEPVFLLSADELSVSVKTRDYRESFYEFSADGYYKTKLDYKYSLGLHLGWKSLKTEGDIPDYKTYTAGLIAGFQNMDNLLNPTSGLRLDWSIEYQNRQYRSDSGVSNLERSSINDVRNQIEIEYIKSISYPIISRWQFNYQSLETSESLPPLSELFLIGGPNSIRGFDSEQFSTIRNAYLNFDLRYRFSSGYLFGFYDLAYLNNHVLSQNIEFKTDEFYRFGYGFGISLIRDNHMLKMSIGWNKDIPFDQPYLTIDISSEI